jgi:hypothetical protein
MKNKLSFFATILAFIFLFSGNIFAENVVNNSSKNNNNKKQTASIHSDYSTYRAKLIKHLFVGQLMKISWANKLTDNSLPLIEILESQIDAYGYDLVIEYKDVVRHIQLKTKKSTGKAQKVAVKASLSAKPSAAVIWIFFDEKDFSFDKFKYFGGKARQKMPDIKNYKIAKHTKGDSTGKKNKRPKQRVIKVAEFTNITNIQDLYDVLTDPNTTIKLKRPLHK